MVFFNKTADATPLHRIAENTSPYSTLRILTTKDFFSQKPTFTFEIEVEKKSRKRDMSF